MEGPPPVRAARPDDLPRVAAIDAECFEGHAYPAFFFRQALDVFGDFFLVVEAPDGGLAGYALGALAAGSAQGWILSMAVRPPFRGRGLAAGLVEALAGRLQARGAREVRLTVDPANRPAAALYAKLGFQPVGGEPGYFGPGERRLVLALTMAG
jgi:ribosomal-protein-alanine N-acetyltransferase